MTTEQAAASDPSCSVWVSASAGSGKTAALTNRVVRLLLHGARPESLLCITYTNAAAGEMTTRVVRMLECCAIGTDSDIDILLNRTGDTILQSMPRKELRSRAAVALDASYRLRIETIHVFCTRLLEEFSSEAGFAPGIHFADEQEDDVWMREAFNEVYNNADNPESVYVRAFEDVSALLPRPDDFLTYLPKINTCLPRDTEHTPDQLYDRIHDALHIPAYARCGEELFRHRYLWPQDDTLEALKRVLPENEEASRMCSTVTAERAYASCSNMAYAAAIEDRGRYFADYCKVFFTEKGEYKKQLLDKNLRKTYPQWLAWCEIERERLAKRYDEYRAITSAASGAALLIAALPVLRAYHALKHRLNAMNFSDMIYYTSCLLRGDADIMHILYRLDRRIKHILVDEAQDTSPEQWDIIHALTEESFHGNLEEVRTLFVVGDEKQSIYRFQGADPKQFAMMRHHYAHRHQTAGRPFKSITLRRVFRCAPEILRFTDALFHTNALTDAVSSDYRDHIAAREGAKGSVTLHPLITMKDTEASEHAVPKDTTDRTHPWLTYALSQDEDTSVHAVAAKHISACVASLIGTQSASCPQGVKASDIMILVRSRTGIAPALRRALSTDNVMVAAPDRISPLSHLIALDVLALLQVCIAPHEDDIALACVLRSPLIRMSDATLEASALAREEEESLYSTLCRLAEGGAEDVKHMVDQLTRYMPFARSGGIYAFFIRVLCEDGYDAIYRYLYPDDADIVIAALLRHAYTFDQDNAAAPEIFLEQARRSQQNDKRDQEDSSGVRIITIHGSKGLQAPIVILADAASVVDRSPDVILSDTVPPVPLYVPKTSERPIVMQEMLERRKQADKDETYRLLYVALTRAMDHLHMFGSLPKGKKCVPDHSFYALAENTLQSDIYS